MRLPDNIPVMSLTPEQVENEREILECKIRKLGRLIESQRGKERRRSEDVLETFYDRYELIHARYCELQKSANNPVPKWLGIRHEEIWDESMKRSKRLDDNLIQGYRSRENPKIR